MFVSYFNILMQSLQLFQCQYRWKSLKFSLIKLFFGDPITTHYLVILLKSLPYGIQSLRINRKLHMAVVVKSLVSFS
jgi:hypothetical protein